MKVWRDKVKENPSSSTPIMCAIREYGGTAAEATGSYLQAEAGDEIQVMLSTRIAGEASNSYRCDYMWGWHVGTAQLSGGWIPVDNLTDG